MDLAGSERAAKTGATAEQLKVVVMKYRLTWQRSLLLFTQRENSIMTIGQVAMMTKNSETMQFLGIFLNHYNFVPKHVKDLKTFAWLSKSVKIKEFGDPLGFW